MTKTKRKTTDEVQLPLPAFEDACSELVRLVSALLDSRGRPRTKNPVRKAATGDGDAKDQLSIVFRAVPTVAVRGGRDRP